MSGRTDLALPRLSLLLGLLWLGMVAVSVGPRADDAQGTRLARLVPRIEPPVVLDRLPRPLSRRDADLYRRIFAVQEKGRWREADRLIGQLRSKLLMGHVLAQRYLHPTAYRSRYSELRAWLAAYADLPEAGRIYRLAVKRRPPGAAPPSRPLNGYLAGAGQNLREPGKQASAAETLPPQARRWLRRIARAVAAGRTAEAATLLKNASKAHVRDVRLRDRGAWIVARGYLADGRDAAAYRLAAAAAERSGEILPGLHWTAGLAAWRLGDRAAAARHFSALATSSLADHEGRAAAAFWAARAHLVTGRPQLAARFLRLSASASDGFYGLIAQATLGQPIRFEWDEPGLRDELVSLLIRFPGSRRALALAQVGQSRLAEAEIRKLAARARPRLLRALAALAESVGLPAAQMRVAQRLRLIDGRRHDGAMFPIPAWQPEGGYRVDRALLFALARAESGFDPNAESARGALGLMQIMPATAVRVASNGNIRYRGRRELRDPVKNLTIGQAYVAQLLEEELSGRSLIHLALAYNAGLSRLKRWDKRLQRFGDDPLLYLESVPVAESRLYVKKVLANLWAYRIRLGQRVPSLEALAANAWPTYVPLEAAEMWRDARSN